MASMAGRRALLFKLSSPSFLSSRSYAFRALALPSSSLPLRLRPLVCAASDRFHLLHASSSVAVGSVRCFATRATTSSLNDPSPNWSNRPPKETILLDGCDFEHWLVVMEPPDPSLTRDEIIDSYIKTLAQVLGSEEEARMSIYSVSTKHYFAFGAKVSEEISYKIKPLSKVRWVLPDSYLDVKNKDYGGEPFIDGKAVPYDPKYHEEWVRNNARAQERSRRNDRPRNFDRSRNFERRRENMQNFQNRDAPPMANQEFQNRNAPPMSNAPNMPPREFQPNSGPPNSSVGMPNYQNQTPNSSGGMPNYRNQLSQQSNYPPNPSGYQGNAHQGVPGGNIPGGPPYQGGSPAYQGGDQAYQGYNPGHQGGNPVYQGGAPGHQGGNPSYNRPGNPTVGNGYQPGGPNFHGGNPNYQQQGVPSHQGQDMPGRDYQ